MDLSTTYAGFSLPHPLMPGASPLADDLDTVRRLEDAGASAIVLRSLFEEQFVLEGAAALREVDNHEETFAEALSYLPETPAFVFGPDEYLEQLHRVRQAVSVPVFASLNGTTPGGWLHFARLLQQAGADGLELNIYQVPTDGGICGHEIEGQAVDMVRTVGRGVNIPVVVKLSQFYSAPAHVARSLDEAGADGLLLFNRFYQPDVDVENLEASPALRLSDSSELLLRLRWLAILAGQVGSSLAVTGGVHTVLDVVKAVMCGAHAVQVVSALLQRGPEHLRSLREGLAAWLVEHEYDSLHQMQGSMSLKRCPDPAAFERANYMQVLQSRPQRV